MLRITPTFKKWALKKWGLPKTTTDDELKTFVGRKLMKNLVTVDQMVKAGAELVKTKAKAKATAGGGGDDDEEGDDVPAKKTPKKKPAKKSATGEREKGRLPDETGEQVRRLVKRQLRALGIRGVVAGDVDPATAFSKSTRIRVKEAADQYETSRKGASFPMFRQAVGGGQVAHRMAGLPCRVPGENTNLDHPSDRDKAIALAWLRYQINRSPLARSSDMPRWARMTQHDKELVLYAAHNEKWVGRVEHDEGTSWVKRRKLTEFDVKTLLDDTNSGGIEITPVVFDDALILIPVLYGELFPFVNVQNVAKGRRVKGGMVQNPPFTSGVGEGTAIIPFNTASYVTAFDTAIYPAVSAVELGQDFEEDSPVDLGGQIIEQFGLKALEWLDRVVAVGNGYNEPQGIFNSTAATLVNSVYGAGGPPTVSDFEGLEFNVAKQFRTEAGASLAYIGNDYTYRKARAIPVGSDDQRRVFGMDHMEYRLLGADFKVQNNIPDGYAAFANLRKFRMYRRLGMQVRVETGGRQLALSNTRLIVVRMRYGGQLEIGGAAALMKDLQVT